MVDQGLIGFDDSDGLYKHLPELAGLEILEGYTEDGKEIAKKPKNKITLRMLLNHTAVRWTEEHKTPNMFDPHTPIEAYITPLAFEPGTRFQYGIGIDWAGHLVCRLSGLNLEEYFNKHIWGPCGIKEISFHPPRNWEKEMMGMTIREPVHTGDLVLMEGPAMGRSYNTDDIGPIYSGGGGLFGTARDYLTFLRHVLASSDSESKGGLKPLIKPDTFKLLFQDSLPDEAIIRKDLAGMAEKQCVHDPAILTEGTGDHIGYGPALFLNKKDSKWGRKAYSGFWDGAAKTMFWLDPETGIAAICHTNLLSHNPDPWNQVYNQLERIIYDNLE